MTVSSLGTRAMVFLELILEGVHFLPLIFNPTVSTLFQHFYISIQKENRLKRNIIVTVCRLQTPTNFICVCVCLCVCVSVCPTFTAYILLTVGRSLIKIGENVGTLVRLIVLKFHCKTPFELCTTCEARKYSKKNKINFFAFLCVSEQTLFTVLHCIFKILIW